MNELSAGHPDAALIRMLLEALGIPHDAARLQDAAAGQPADGESSQRWLRRVLTTAQIHDVTPVRIPWHRFDPRRLPVLLLHAGVWYLASASRNQDVLLTDADGVQSQVDAARLGGAQVLWLRRPGRRPQHSPSTHALATRVVWSELFRDRGWLWKIVVATCLVNLIGIATALFAMQVYDRVVPTLAYATLTTLVAGMALVIALDWTLKTIRARILDSLSCAVDQRLSQRVFEHLLHVQLDAQPRTLGTLAAQIGSLDAVRQFFSATVVFALVDLPFVLLFLVFIAVIGGAVAWVYALLLPAALLLGLITQWRLRGLLQRQLSRSHERQGLLVDSIRGAESIRASNAGWRFAGEWREVTGTINRYAIQQRAISSLSTVTTSSLSTAAYVAGVVVGVWQIEAGLLTMGGLIACSILGGRIIAPVAQSVQYLVQWQHVRQALDLMGILLGLPSQRRPDQRLLLPDDAAPAISLEGVRFSYPDSPVRQLDVAELHLAAGDRVLLAGPVGAGKSTLLKVLAGLYRPHEGRVRLGDAELWETDPLLLASRIGYLPQSVHLFRGSLTSNLCLAGNADDELLLEVSRALGIDAIAAASPRGMEAPISEGGEGLSGGQRQLVALGRVLLQQPRIWLLDEPTASLDRDMEERVWRTLEATLRDDDVLVVSTHRPLPASRLMNRVLVMQHGQVIRDGTPELLLPQLVRQPQRQPAVVTGKADVV